MKALAAAAVLAATFLVLTLPTPATAATSRSLLIDASTAQPTVPFKTFDGNPPKLFDINRDGRQEIIAQNDNQWVYVFDSGNGDLLAEMKTTFPSGWGARSFNGPEAAVFDTAGTVRVVVENSAAVVTMYRYAGSNGQHWIFEKEWERRPSECFGSPGSDSKPVLADLDRDGHFEIIVATEEVGIYVYRDTGALYWKACIGGGNAEPEVGDLNMDGWPDVVFGSDGGVVTALNGRTGGTLWSYSVLAHFNLQSGSMPVGVGIGQVDGVGGPDVVVGARDSHDATTWSNDHALLLALDAGGRFLWKFQDPGGNPLTYTHAIIADADHDGANEIYWADWNTIGHKPPYNEADSWKTTGPAHF
ncbi:MAG: VCBS repeat-containing protein, partial [Halobacteriales archaeon]|nr:VCBS repeat-containing protein [Halobacteriales archaeon]